MLRPLAGKLGNLLAWAGVGVVIAVSLAVVLRLGFMGLLLLGLATWLICTRVSLSEEGPTWGAEVFRARMVMPSSPEQRAALRAERVARAAPLAFCRWCGIVLAAMGAAGFAWQQWG